jgi:uncharacterized protein (DUF427 family)
MGDYPGMIVAAGHIEPVPRRIRAWLGGTVVLDTTSARYVWEWPPYPQYYIPRADLARGVLVDEHQTEQVRGATVYRYGLRAGGLERPGAALVYPEAETSALAGNDADADSPTESVAGLVRLDWAALDAWFEEDEQVFVHPRNPYARVDAVRSGRHVRIELDGVHNQRLLVGAGGRHPVPGPGLGLRLSHPGAAVHRGAGGLLQRAGGYPAGRSRAAQA